MSTPGSPAALEPTAALMALLMDAPVRSYRGDDTLNAQRQRAVDEFLATWVVCRPSDILDERGAQAEWQRDAKLAFAILVTALGNIGAQYPALNLGPRVLAEAEKMIREKGLDPDEVLERFLP